MLHSARFVVSLAFGILALQKQARGEGKRDRESEERECRREIKKDRERLREMEGWRWTERDGAGESV